MSEEGSYEFDQVVPNAAPEAQQFLEELRSLSQREAGVAEWGLALRKPSRLKNRVVLSGSYQMGNAWRKARPVQLEAYADPIGDHLQVGYQVTWGSGLFFSALPIGDEDPKLIRKVDGMLTVFQQSVFLPALEQLLAVAEQRQPSASD